MSEAARPPHPIFVFLLVPLTAVSLPSLVYCSAGVAMALHGAWSRGTMVLHLPPENAWDSLFVLQTHVHQWISRWNSLATLAATAFLVSALLLPRWRTWAGLALIPYGVLLCADFTMRWRYAFMP